MGIIAEVVIKKVQALQSTNDKKLYYKEHKIGGQGFIHKIYFKYLTKA